MPSDFQVSFLSDSELQAAHRSQYQNMPAAAAMGVVELQAWKARVAGFQATVTETPAAVQGSLFEPESASAADAIAPFQLPQQNTEFWRWRAADVGTAALYFVIDYQTMLLLYVGETVKSNQRWKGVHDCKRYLLNYRQIHYQLDLESQLGIAFWAQAPTERRARQQLESALIRKWRSPFNKENWAFWQTPFVGESL
ncbi:MAG: GIY-YIG nuclease family protein [Leptolyngbya sp. SIO4C1]|nr:GIY-YIG nuclease family protein [Leptolyngbya sp. SIO4C1]